MSTRAAELERRPDRQLIEGGEIVFLPVERIAPNPYQPRRVFQKESIEELADSIRIYGVIQPITVRVINGSYYELVAGERRLRASKLAGLYEIPAIIVNINDKDSAFLALIENLQRENLNFFDEAEGLKSLIDDYGFTQEEIAKRIGKNQSTVANKIRVLKLPREIQRALLENGQTERHARALLRLIPDAYGQLASVTNKIIAGNLTVKATERLVEAALTGQKQPAPETSRQRVKSYFKDVRILKNTIEQAVVMMNSSGLPTEYDIEERDDGCIISIMVSYAL